MIMHVLSVYSSFNSLGITIRSQNNWPKIKYRTSFFCIKSDVVVYWDGIMTLTASDESFKIDRLLHVWVKLK